jgi:hypothetical protein
MNGCDYIFTIGKKNAEDNTVHLDCTNGTRVEIEVTIPLFADCTLTIEEQSPEGGVAYTAGELEGKADVTADVTVEGVNVIRHGNSLCGPAEGNSGELTGTATLGGTDG